MDCFCSLLSFLSISFKRSSFFLLFGLSRGVQLHSKCQPVTGNGQPLSGHPVPHLTDQPGHISDIMPPNGLRLTERQPCSVQLLPAPWPETQCCPGPGKPSNWDHGLQPVSRGRGGGEQHWRPNHQTGCQLHRDPDAAQRRWLPRSQLPQPREQHLVPQLQLRGVLLRVQLLQLRDLAAKLSLAVSLCLPQGLVVASVVPARQRPCAFPSPFSLHLPSDRSDGWGRLAHPTPRLPAELPVVQRRQRVCYGKEKAQLQRCPLQSDALLAHPVAHAIAAGLPQGQHHGRELARQHQPVHQLCHRGRHQCSDHGRDGWHRGRNPSQDTKDHAGPLVLHELEGGAQWRRPRWWALPWGLPLTTGPKEGELLWRVPGCAPASILLVQTQALPQVGILSPSPKSLF